MIVRTDGDGNGGGLFYEGQKGRQKLVRIKDTKLETVCESGSRYHKSLLAELNLEDGRKRLLEGKVMGFIPLRNRRKGSHIHVGEGMTQYTLDGEVIGYGLSQYLDQPKSDEVNE